MRPFTPEKRSGTIAVRDLRPGDKVDIGEVVAVVAKIERTDKYVFGSATKKTALALRISFLDREPILAHPAQEAHLV